MCKHAKIHTGRKNIYDSYYFVWYEKEPFEHVEEEYSLSDVNTSFECQFLSCTCSVGRIYDRFLFKASRAETNNNRTAYTVPEVSTVKKYLSC